MNEKFKDTELINIENMYDNKFTINEVNYMNLHQIVNVTCNECGKSRNIKLASLKYRGTCPFCSRNKVSESVNNKVYVNYVKLCKEYCDDNGYTFIEIFAKYKDQSDKQNVWYLRFNPNRKDRNGKEYGEILQSICSIQQGKTPKCFTSDKLAKNSEQWIEEAKCIHPEYDYSKTKYDTCNKPVIIICPKHGEFNVLPKVFIKEDYCCGQCKKEKTVIKHGLDAIAKVKEKYNNYYDYDFATYTRMNDKMKMYCPEHGEFWMSIKNHLMGSVCPQCAHKNRGEKRSITKEEFFKRTRETHKHKYDYSKVVYNGYNDKVCIVCNEIDKYGIKHGEFWMTPKEHCLGQGCPKCGGTGKRTQGDFLQRAKAVHGDKYDYSKVKYKRNNDKVCIICHEKDEFGEEHGEFWQTPKIHLKGNGCSKCSGNYLDRDLFIKRSNVVHDNKYDYSRVIYKTNHTKVDIICPEHGVFSMMPYCHLHGKQGCPLCKESHLEREIRILLNNNNINFNTQQRFDWLRNETTNYNLPLDFYLPDYNVAIECQGEQHFIGNFYKSKGIEYAQEHLKGVQERDKVKKLKCKENNVQLIYFTETYLIKHLENEDTPYFTKPSDLLKFLKNMS